MLGNRLQESGQAALGPTAPTFASFANLIVITVCETNQLTCDVAELVAKGFGVGGKDSIRRGWNHRRSNRRHGETPIRRMVIGPPLVKIRGRDEGKRPPLGLLGNKKRLHTWTNEVTASRTCAAHLQSI